MSRNKVGLFLLVLSLIFGVFGASIAQEMPPLPGDEVLGGLGAPRGIAFDADGNLYVTDAGTGGEAEMMMMGPEGETTASLGMTGKIVVVAPDGSTSDFITGIPSTALAGEIGETTGIYRAIPHGESVWLLTTGSGPATFGAYWGNNIVEIDAATMATKRIINMDGHELANDPDGNGYDSNVADIAWGPDGTLYIVDAGANSLLSWTEEAGLQVVQSWGNDVPDAIEIAENGDIYIGFLGEALAPMAAKIEVWSGGELVETFGGLTAVTDILLDGDTLYAVQLFEFGDEGPGPGSVVTVSAEGITPVAGGLLAPFALAMSPEGDLYVSYGTLPLMPGLPGGVLKLSQ